VYPEDLTGFFPVVDCFGVGSNLPYIGFEKNFDLTNLPTLND